MEDDNKPVDDVRDESTPDASGEDQGKEAVSFETHRKLLSEKKKLQEQQREALEKLKQYEAERKAREKKELEARGEFQKIAQNAEERAKELEAQLNEVLENQRGQRKLAAVLKALPGDVANKYWDLIPFSDVVINPDTDQVDEMSVTKAVDKFIATYPEVIQKPGQQGFSMQAPKGIGSSGRIAREEWLKLSPKEMKKWKPEQIRD